MHLRGCDIEARHGHYLVHLTSVHTATSHSPSRTTIVHESYNPIVERLLRDAGDGILAHASATPTAASFTSIRKWLVYNDALPELSPRRLRATWLRDALNAPVPVRTVLDAAGLMSIDFAAVGASLIDDDSQGHLTVLASHRAAPRPGARPGNTTTGAP